MQAYLGCVALHGIVYAAAPALLPTVSALRAGGVVGSAFYLSWQCMKVVPLSKTERFQMLQKVCVMAFTTLSTTGISFGAFALQGLQVSLMQTAIASVAPVGGLILVGAFLKFGTPLVNKVWSSVCNLFLSTSS